ncbi:Hypothetical predicted protein [Cloeon dipterum]|uniref:Uncharacterized protein n=1 Tax=Cloeon dipterum TaxID=197152 RepID=A0A8S1DNX5_9INSE|nr:Hypothetical predicted protein [Cloeon dipterum]
MTQAWTYPMGVTLPNPGLEQTQNRLRALRAQTEDTEVKDFVVNIPLFVRGSRLKNLDPEKRVKYLKALMDLKGWDDNKENLIRHTQRTVVFKNLLSSEEDIATKEVILDNLFAFCPKHLLKIHRLMLLDWLARYAEKLEILTLRTEVPLGVVALEDSGVASICQLKMLNKLLTHIDVTIVSTCEGLEGDLNKFYSSFSLLKVFLFRAIGACSCSPHYSTFEDHLYGLCIKYLPNIEVVREYADNTMCKSQNILNFPRITSALRHLSTFPSEYDWSSKFPEVTHLKIQETLKLANPDLVNKQIEAMMHFKKIKSLQLEQFSSLTRFLNTYGAHLHTLILSKPPRNSTVLEFKTIFASCPNLETLRLVKIPKIIDDAIPFANPYPSLKELEWKPTSSGNACLSKILSAAINLEKLVLKGRYFNVTDLEEVSKLVANKRILKNLTTFHFHMLSNNSYPYQQTEEEQIDEDWIKLFVALGSLIRNASVVIPNLVDVEVMPGTRIVTRKVENSSRPAELFTILQEEDGELFEAELAIKVIVKNIANWSEGQVEHLRNLSPPVRQKVLKALMSLKSPFKIDLDKITYALELLLCPEENTGTHSLELDGFLSFLPISLAYNKIQKIVKIIFNGAPNLRSLSLNHPCWSLLLRVNRHIFKNLRKLEMLQKLELNLIRYKNLAKICKKLKNLRHVTVSFMTDSLHFRIENDIVEFRRSFSHLKVFCFASSSSHYCSTVMFSNFELHLRSLCIQYLPNLEVAGEYFDTGRCNCQWIVQFPSQISALQHLSAPAEEREWSTTFPNVTHLKVHFFDVIAEKQLEAMLQFPKIVGLNLERCPTREIMQEFLVRYGENLDTLILSSSRESHISLELKTLFQSCPKLEKLCLKNVSLKNESMQYFPSLRELDWQPNRTTYARLSKILPAVPNLERLYMKTRCFKAIDLKKVSRLFRHKKILKELVTINFELHPYGQYYEKELQRFFPSWSMSSSASHRS